MARYAEIVDLHDDLLLPWLKLYETTFPPAERLLVASLLGMLKEPARAGGNRMLAMVEADGSFVGLALYELLAEASAAALWYLAVTPERRGQGLGGDFYREIVHRLGDLPVRALLYEVEMPAQAEAPRLARRRIRFYQRHGGKLLRGIHYMQSVGSHQPPIPMHLMVHPLHPPQMAPAEAFDLAARVFGTSVTRVGTLRLA